MNKTDPYVNFDPTQIEGGCCGDVQFDNTSMTWKQTPPRASSNEDCSQVQTQLDQANATIADQNRLLEQKAKEVAEVENKLTDLEKDFGELEEKAKEAVAYVEQLEKNKADLEKKVAELEAQLANQPSECDILNKHLDPIYRLNGELIGYGIKNPPECLKNIEPVTGLNPDNEIGNVVSPPPTHGVKITYE